MALTEPTVFEQVVADEICRGRCTNSNGHVPPARRYLHALATDPRVREALAEAMGAAHADPGGTSTK